MLYVRIGATFLFYLFTADSAQQSQEKAQIKENHRLCLKRLRPSLWLDMDEVRQCFTMAVRRRLLVSFDFGHELYVYPFFV